MVWAVSNLALAAYAALICRRGPCPGHQRLSSPAHARTHACLPGGLQSTTRAACASEHHLPRMRSPAAPAPRRMEHSRPPPRSCRRSRGPRRQCRGAPAHLTARLPLRSCNAPPRTCASAADFFATWCNGCQRSYPELCKYARDPDLSSKVKFVKVRSGSLGAGCSEHGCCHAPRLRAPGSFTLCLRAPRCRTGAEQATKMRACARTKLDTHACARVRRCASRS